jgi:hypothetical protein
MAHILFFVAISLFVFNSGDYHACPDDDHHEPICDECSCIVCSSGLVGIDISGEDFEVDYILSTDLVLSEYNSKFGEIVTELDQPPRS